jgi:hypothetical protein
VVGEAPDLSQKNLPVGAGMGEGRSKMKRQTRSRTSVTPVVDGP